MRIPFVERVVGRTPHEQALISTGMKAPLIALTTAAPLFALDTLVNAAMQHSFGGGTLVELGVAAVTGFAGATGIHAVSQGDNTVQTERQLGQQTEHGVYERGYSPRVRQTDVSVRVNSPTHGTHVYPEPIGTQGTRLNQGWPGQRTPYSQRLMMAAYKLPFFTGVVTAVLGTPWWMATGGHSSMGEYLFKLGAGITLGATSATGMGEVSHANELVKNDITLEQADRYGRLAPGYRPVVKQRRSDVQVDNTGSGTYAVGLPGQGFYAQAGGDPSVRWDAPSHRPSAEPPPDEPYSYR